MKIFLLAFFCYYFLTIICCFASLSPPSPSPPPPVPTPPPPPSPVCNVSLIITRELYDEMLPHRDDPGCEIDFYEYDDFIEAANFFQGFGTTGDLNTCKRELAAFFGQTSYETAGSCEDTNYTRGYCIKKDPNPTSDYCINSKLWPCNPKMMYYGRGPLLIKHNTNYGPCGEAINYDLLNRAYHAEEDAPTAFKTAIWFWMTTPKDSPIPTSHDVIINNWTTSICDDSAGRKPGYGAITNIINGWDECGKGPNQNGKKRIGYYKRYCDMLKVSPGDNLDCYNQMNFTMCNFNHSATDEILIENQ